MQPKHNGPDPDQAFLVAVVPNKGKVVCRPSHFSLCAPSLVFAGPQVATAGQGRGGALHGSHVVQAGSKQAPSPRKDVLQVLRRVNLNIRKGNTKL